MAMLVRCTPALRSSLAALLLAVSAPAFAQGDGTGELPGVFTVQDVEVDVTAKSATAARDQGIAEAQRNGWAKLLRRLMLDEEARSVPQVGAAELEPMVTGFEVQEERTSAVRYLAKYTVRFDPAAVRAYLRGNGLRYAEMRSKPVLVLPVDSTGGTPVLWEQATPWRQTWADMDLPGGLVPLAVPYGEAQDVADVSAQQALSGDADALRRIAGRYDASAVAVAELKGAEAQVTVHRFDGQPESFTVPVAGGAADALAGVPDAVAGRLEDAWTNANLIIPGRENVLQVQVPFTEMSQWMETRKRLSQVPTVTNVRVASLSRGLAQVEMSYLGDEAQLRNALAQRDLELGEPMATATGAPARELRLRAAAARPAAETAAPAADPSAPAPLTPR